MCSSHEIRPRIVETFMGDCYRTRQAVAQASIIDAALGAKGPILAPLNLLTLGAFKNSPGVPGSSLFLITLSPQSLYHTLLLLSSLLSIILSFPI